MELQRWQALMTAFNFGPNLAMYQKLVAAYAEPHRHYHTAEHVQACLRHLDNHAALATQQHEIELALWFHDAIYQPFKHNNEAVSANWAVAFLQQQSAAVSTINTIHRLIMVTEHNAPTQTNDEALLVDIDLAILGSSPEVYQTFETAVRQEYRRVPRFIYKKNRKAILQGFLDREHIYQHATFQKKLTAPARLNLTAAIQQL